MASDYDYIIVGGGTVGCVLASRISHAGHRVALFEAGPENYSAEIMSPIGAPRLHGTEAEYNWKTVAQPGLGNREIDTHGGKLLSGSSGVNYGLWTRGHSADYDAWARHVGDDKWSYSGLLKYFKKTENWHDKSASPDVHGFDGPISTFAGLRNYPLKASVLKALEQSGLEFNPDGNDGTPFGISAFTDNFKDNLRQPAGLAYNLSKAHVFTNSIVARVEIDAGSKTATGVVLNDGRSFKASKEVIVSAGAIKTPQVLLLSGVGPKQHLDSLGISTIADLPVGKNLHDHISGSIFWKLKNPEKGLALGNPNFNEPRYFTGMPFDWIATITVPEDKLSPAASADGQSISSLFGGGQRAHVEMLTAYAPIASHGTPYRLPVDGTHIATPIILLLPTGRGSVTLSSTDATADPIIDPQYLATEVDRTIMREGVRAALRYMETPEAQTFVEHETPPPGYPRLTSASTDAEIDARLQYIAASFFQNAGTASMGSVVDTDCKVKGVGNLRVVDASILPFPIASHYQAGIYAIGEAAADIILGKAS